MTFVTLAIGTETVPRRRLPIVPIPGTTSRARPLTGQATFGSPPGTAPWVGTSHSCAVAVRCTATIEDAVAGAVGQVTEAPTARARMMDVLRTVAGMRRLPEYEDEGAAPAVAPSNCQ
ncbi:hypothetical protein GCM10022223_03260 [Kineosporia mesophila]|uniref:Uncharacterized protein n=1 Tax=Kineosporia mesophila TaxID=566012 RepID=A0ABP6YY49_9ACTN